MNIADVMELDAIQRGKEAYYSQKNDGFVQLSLERYQELVLREQVCKFVVEKLYDFEKNGSFLNVSDVSGWLNKVNSFIEGKIS